MPSIVMTLIGKDRPGLVESLAEVVAKHNANWLDGRMSHLAGQFAGILQVDVATDNVDQLVGALRKLGEQGLSVIVETDQGPVGNLSAGVAGPPVIEMELLPPELTLESLSEQLEQIAGDMMVDIKVHEAS